MNKIFRCLALIVFAFLCVSQSDAQTSWPRQEHVPQDASLQEMLSSDTRVSSAVSSEQIAFYYVSGPQHGIWRATRKADGTWDRGSRILLNGVFNGNAVDPDIIQLEDGRYRLYYFLGNFVSPFPPSNGFFSAISSDGINFTTEGQIITLTSIATDPSVVRLANGSYLLAGARQTQSGTDIIFATSNDGRSFQTNGVVLSNAGIPELTLLADGSVRLFYNGPGGIVSQRSTNGGTTWQAESGVRLSFQAFLGDPSVLRRADGSWVMFVKGFNNTGLQTPNGHNVRMAESQDGFTFSLVGGVLMDSASVPEAVSMPTAPTAPTLALPSDGATGVATNPTLSWNAATGATSYRLQVSTSSTFSTTVYDQSGITGTSQQVSGLANNTLYYWRVNATNAGGTSGYSSTRSFTTIVAAPAAPTLVLPSDGATGVATNPTLSWNAATGATSYRLQVSTSSAFSPTVYDQSGITGTSQQVSGLANNTLYYWRVNATNAGGTSSYSTTWRFTTTGPTTVKHIGHEIPTTYALYQNYPNPFNPVTTIQFAVPKESHVKLTIFNSLGMHIEILVDEHLPPGQYRTQWTPQDIPSGVYFYQLRSAEFVDTKKLLFLR